LWRGATRFFFSVGTYTVPNASRLSVELGLAGRGIGRTGRLQVCIDTARIYTHIHTPCTDTDTRMSAYGPITTRRADADAVQLAPMLLALRFPPPGTASANEPPAQLAVYHLPAAPPSESSDAAPPTAPAPAPPTPRTPHTHGHRRALRAPPRALRRGARARHDVPAAGPARARRVRGVLLRARRGGPLCGRARGRRAAGGRTACPGRRGSRRAGTRAG
jgi:hypothetical protein